MGLVKYDHPPLLAPGRHFVSLSRIDALCVREFQRSLPGGIAGAGLAQRTLLYLALENLVQRLLVDRIRCDVVVDGSFLTTKPVPDDVDVIVTVEHAIYTALSSEQMDLLDSINSNRFGPNVDALAVVEYPREHKDHGSALDGSLMIEGYGIEHSQQWLKGFAVIRLWEADVRNRFCR